ncbi:MAG: hypothetical protein WC872_02175 [Candidatus Absconditabacterales bacterium]
MILKYIFSIILSGIIAFLGIKIFAKLNILDRPGKDLKNTRKPVPTIQGVFVYIGFIVISLILFPSFGHNNIFIGLAIGSLPIVLVQLLDELHYIGKFKLKIPQLVRLLSHILGGILAIYFGKIGAQEFIIGSNVFFVPQRFVAIFFIGRSILCINAINWFDGIYAQASGISCIGFLTIFLLIQFVVFGHYVNFTEINLQILNTVKNISFILFGISLVSTFVEYKPLALVRDVGIMFFGFALAYLSVVGGAKIGTLIVTLSLVIFDAIWVGFYRIFVIKKNPLKGDYTHLHHRLLGLGRNRIETRAFIRIWSLVMMILILIQGTDRTNKLIIFAMMAIIFFGVNIYIFLVKKSQCGLKMEKE